MTLCMGIGMSVDLVDPSHCCSRFVRLSCSSWRPCHSILSACSPQIPCQPVSFLLYSSLMASIDQSYGFCRLDWSILLTTNVLVDLMSLAFQLLWVLLLDFLCFFFTNDLGNLSLSHQHLVSSNTLHLLQSSRDGNSGTTCLLVQVFSKTLRSVLEDFAIR